VVEENFEKLLRKITPSPAIISVVQEMILQAKEDKQRNYHEIVDHLKKEKLLIERKTEQFLERIIAADSHLLVTTYERQIKQLEEKRIVAEEKIQRCGTFDEGFEMVNRTSMEFLANPHDF